MALPRLRFYAGTCARLVSAPWLQRSIAPEEATSLFGCSFGNGGWHHLRDTLREYDRNPGVDFRDTTLYRYLKDFCPTTTCAVLAPDCDAPELPLFHYPWGTFRRGELESRKDPWASRFCGPSTDDFVSDEFQRTIVLYERMRREGYRPMGYGHSYIGGTFLISEEGNRRFVVLQGNHRLAILAHLGYGRIAVRNVRGWLARVLESEIDEWPLVRNGRCSVRHARAVFRSFFERDGNHVRLLIEGQETERAARHAKPGFAEYSSGATS